MLLPKPSPLILRQLLKLRELVGVHLLLRNLHGSRSCRLRPRGPFASNWIWKTVCMKLMCITRRQLSDTKQ